MTKIKLNFRSLSIPEKIARAQQVVAALTGNPNFPAPHPPLTEVTAAIGALETSARAAHAARIEARMLTAEQRRHEAALLRVMTQLVSHVDSVAGDNESLILSAALDMRAASTTVSLPAAPEGLAAADGSSPGEIELTWEAVRGARAYVVERSSDAQNAAPAWTHVVVAPRSRAFVSGLESGTRYWFRVAAVNAAGQSPWCNAAFKIAP